MNERIGGSFSKPLSDTPGPAFSAALIMIAIANMNRTGNIAHPIGIPTYKLCRPVVWLVVKHIQKYL